MAGAPKDALPEFAFIGRSNVGKSSLINLLAQRRDLALVSATPGKTRLLNFFRINNDWRLVDLPGYGYAKGAKGDRADFNVAVADYLERGENVSCVFALIDVSIAPQRLDIEFLRWLDGCDVAYAVVFTKADKLGGGRLHSLILTESNLDPSPVGATSRKIGSQSSEAFLCHGYADLLARAQRSNPLWGATLAHWLSEAAWRISRSAMSGGSPSWRQQLYDLKKPKSYLFGVRSLPSEDVEVLRAHGVRVEIIPDAGHSMALENPKSLAATIAAIMQDCQEGF